MSANASNPTPVVPQLRPIRRVVTGHDANGRSVILYDSVSPHVECVMGIPTLGPTELWVTRETPTRNTGAPDPVTLPVKIAPPRPCGFWLRIALTRTVKLGKLTGAAFRCWRARCPSGGSDPTGRAIP